MIHPWDGLLILCVLDSLPMIYELPILWLSEMFSGTEGAVYNDARCFEAKYRLLLKAIRGCDILRNVATGQADHYQGRACHWYSIQDEADSKGAGACQEPPCRWMLLYWY